jgi:hypothetical protein
LVGAPFLELLQLSVDAADAREAGSRVLKPFAFASKDDQAKFGGFAKKFAEQLPFKANWISESLTTDKRYDALNALFFATRGRPGVYAKLHEHSTVMACRHTGDSEVLTKEHFCAAFDLRYLANSKYSGCNPFKDSDYARLPNIALSVDQDEFDEQTKAFMKTKLGSRKGGKLYGDGQ